MPARQATSLILYCLLLWCALAGCAAAAAAAGQHVPGKHHSGIKRVSIVFACHLDVGFASGGPEPGYDNVVISRYFNEYFPAAAATGAALRARGGDERLVFLTHSWLVSLFLDCPARIGIQCPNTTTVAGFKEAVLQGDITWHALPHNGQVELYDADLLRWAVELGHGLDRDFGLPPKVTASQRDVPGLTRAAVPILAAAGVKAITVGVNGASAPPGVPHNRPFVWQDAASGASLLAMVHPGGYSGTPVDSPEECVQAAGLHHALCFAWRNGNTGAPSAEEVLDIHARVRAGFPGARVAAAGLDAFVEELAAAAPRLDLPVVTGEIGDTWIYGIASDPAKLSEYRALLRMRSASRERYDDDAFQRFSRLLLKIPEHTWGVDTKVFPGDYEAWSNADFHRRLEEKGDSNPFQVAVRSWVRQRAYSIWAVQELGSSAAGVRAWGALAALQDGKAPPAPGAANSSFKRSSLQEALVFEGPSWQLELSNMTGAIVGLRFKGCTDQRGCQNSNRSGGTDPESWAAAWLRAPAAWLGRRGGSAAPLQEALQQASWAAFDAPLALPIYSTYAEDDYDAIFGRYTWASTVWSLRDFGKPNATVKGGARRAEYLPLAEEVWWKPTAGGGVHVVVKASFDAYAVQNAGAPAAIWTEIRLPADSEDVLVDVTWERKTATRLPEAMWLRWAPQHDAVNASTWLLWKLGHPISPLEVVLNGSQAQHAVGDEGVSVDSVDGRQRLYIRSLDAALVSPGAATPFPQLRDAPDLRRGVSHCLVNNIWGTNYAMWFPYNSGDSNMRFRFVLQLEERPQEQQRGASAPGRPSPLRHGAVAAQL